MQRNHSDAQPVFANHSHPRSIYQAASTFASSLRTKKSDRPAKKPKKKKAKRKRETLPQPQHSPARISARPVSSTRARKLLGACLSCFLPCGTKAPRGIFAMRPVLVDSSKATGGFVIRARGSMILSLSMRRKSCNEDEVLWGRLREGVGV